MARNTHLQLPKALTGYEFRPRRSELEIVIPEATTNLVTNPGFEMNTTGWTAGAGSLSRASGDVFRGAFCARYTPGAAAGDGCYFGTLALTAGQPYTFSIRFKGAAGQRYRITFADTSGVALTTKAFVATGRWQYVWLVWRETATTSRRIYVAKDTANTSTQPFSFDDVQVENKAYPTTYCDGDLKGFVRGRTDYTWAGRPHASTSSRSATCAHGGRVVNINKFGFRVLATVGLGFGFVLNRSTPLAMGGAIYQDTLQLERAWTVAGVIDGKSQDIRRARADLAAALHANRVGIDQPVMILHTPIERGVPAGDTVEVPSLYESGLQVNLDNDNQSQVTLAFSLYLPYLSATRNQSAEIPMVSVLTTTSGTSLILRYPDGRLASYGMTASGTLTAAFNPVDGQVYAGAGGHPVAWNAATGTTASLTGHAWGIAVTYLAIEAMPDGTVLFAVQDGATYYFQRYDPLTNTWATAITANGVIRAIAVNQATGAIAVGGDFTTFNGTAANRVAVSIDGGSTWAALGTGANAGVYALAWSLDGDLLYIGGVFTNFNGNGDWNFSYWSMTTGTAGLPLFLNTFSGTGVSAIAVGPDGTVYIGGNLAASLGTAPDYALAKMDRTWPVRSVGVATTSGSDASALAVGPDGALYAELRTGDIVGVTGWPVYTNFPRVRVNTYVIRSGSASLFDVESMYVTLDVNARGDVLVGGDDRNLVSTAVDVDNASSTSSFPTMVFEGPAILRRIENVTTGSVINTYLSIASGERVTFEFAADGWRLSSPLRQNLAWAVLPGSLVSTFTMAPGTNRILLHSTTDPVVSGGQPTIWARYAIAGVTQSNSDNGTLYVSIVNTGGSNRRVDLYRDAARTQLVGQSNVAVLGPFVITPQNGSGLGGYMTMKSSEATPPNATTSMSLKFGTCILYWPIVHDSVDATVE